MIAYRVCLHVYCDFEIKSKKPKNKRMTNVDFMERILIIHCSLKKNPVDRTERTVLTHENDELLTCI